MDGLHFTSTEQYIMYRKCVILGDEAAAQKVLATNVPSQQKAIAHSVKPYNAILWEGLRQAVALRGLIAKFGQNDDLKEQLLATEDAYLVECSHSDKDWACNCGLDEESRKDMRQWTGKNILGFALMEARSFFR